MSWQTGAVLYMGLLIFVSAVSLWFHGSQMRRRARRREMIDRYSKLVWK